MKRRSPKTAAIYREWNPIRRAFVESGPCCHCSGFADDCHEMIGGGSRMAAFVERATWLRVCRTCHSTVQYMSKPEQLALKLISDPEYFDLEKFCEVWGRPTSAVTPGEVIEALRNLYMRRVA